MCVCLCVYVCVCVGVRGTVGSEPDLFQTKTRPFCSFNKKNPLPVHASTFLQHQEFFFIIRK